MCDVYNKICGSRQAVTGCVLLHCVTLGYTGLVCHSACVVCSVQHSRITWAAQSDQSKLGSSEVREV